MTDKKRATVWLALAMMGLAGLLVCRGLQWDWIQPVGIFFLATPILATLLTVRLDFKDDPLTAGCVVGLIAVFCFALLF